MQRIDMTVSSDAHVTAANVAGMKEVLNGALVPPQEGVSASLSGNVITLSSVKLQVKETLHVGYMQAVRCLTIASCFVPNRL